MPRDVSLSDSKFWNGGHEWVNLKSLWCNQTPYRLLTRTPAGAVAGFSSLVVTESVDEGALLPTSLRAATKTPYVDAGVRGPSLVLRARLLVLGPSARLVLGPSARLVLGPSARLVTESAISDRFTTYSFLPS